MNKIKKSCGFTIIELIIVISILGILASFVLPRFANFTASAKTTSRTGIVSTLNSAIGISHAQWIANGSIGTVTLDGGGSITMNATGYPDIAVTYNTAALCQTLMNNLLSNVTSGIAGSYSAPNCTVTNANWSSSITLASQLAS